MSWLEQLVREYYEVQGYWVRTNVRFGPRERGGYAGEADVLAFQREGSVLVHIEASMGAESWKNTKKKLKNKFDKAPPYYEEMFPHFPIERIERIAVVGRTLAAPKIEVPGVELITLGQFVQLVVSAVTEKFKVAGTKCPPEQFPLLRTLFFAKKWERRTAKKDERA